ncbi:hypothetical protein [Photobacterium sp. TY1-4]|nr:hypothetical protein [Photobacterium sp. TY1-4]UXI03247.1 hypothetical protein NH461_22710 [Photobacterium sp. TY1-4]
MLLKAHFPSGRTMTYHRNLQALMHSFDQAGITYELITDPATRLRSNR